MQSCSPRQTAERAQPWLGTLVSIRVEALPPAEAHAAISAAFDEIAVVHRLMSFHEPQSDVSRINREARFREVEVHPHTVEVLKHALALSAATDGCFDVSVGAELVRRGLLPAPADTRESPVGTWRDIELASNQTIHFRRPLWIDLGGIGKGYAVDRAANCLRAQGIVRAVINAGGDIRVLGNQPEKIALGLNLPSRTRPVIELSGGSMASSSGDIDSPHLDGTHRPATHTSRFVCVLAKNCITADALTKVVMAKGRSSEPILRQFGATAHLFDAA